MQRVVVAFLLFLVAVCADAQQPKAVVTGPKEARCGALVILDASESAGTGRMWLLAVSPEETSFLTVENGLKCVFASPTSGAYTFVLVTAGTNPNGGPAVDMVKHTVVLSGGVTPPDPPEPPGPSANPYTPPSSAIRAALGAVAMKMSRADATVLAGLYAEAGRLVASAPAAKAAGVKPEVGTTSELRAWLVEQGKSLGLSGRYGSLGGAVDEFLAGKLGLQVRDVRETDAESLNGLAWAIWENGR